MTNSQLNICEIGDRVECLGYIGTVQYVGPIEGKPSAWVGIDWDNPKRGKHNGMVNNTQYFTTRHPTSGSFVRPEKLDFGKSVVTSIVTRYGQQEDEFTAKINNQKQLLIQQNMNAPFLEMVGFDKIFSKQSDFNSLKVINLRNQNVSSVGDLKELGDTCPNIEELDISKNLLSSWSHVFDICSVLKNLHWLNVSENLLLVPENFPDFSYPNIKTLICGQMHLDWETVLKIGVVFPAVEEFRAPYNNITQITPTDIFPSLTLLDIEGNMIKEWSEICKLDCLPQIEQLIIENIGLTSIYFNEEGPKVSTFTSLKKLCLVNNLINEWKSFSELNRLKNLDNLKIMKNPVLDQENIETIHQLIIANIENLKILNGVEIEAGERRGAEYDYIKKYGLEWLKVKGTAEEKSFLKLHNRYLELIQRYGELEESELLVKPTVIQSSLIDLILVHENHIIHKKIPPSMTVQKVVMMVQKLFRLQERPILNYVSSRDFNIEFELDDELREIGLYSMHDGDQIIVKT